MKIVPAEVTIRSGVLSDMTEMQTLFLDTITSVCAKDYSPEQIRVWTDSVKNEKRWTDVLRSQFVIIAESEGRMVGYATLEGKDYLDFLYVHRLYQGRGIARRLVSDIVQEALKRGATDLYSDVSITARTFFEKEGFRVLAQQTRNIDSVDITNYKMCRQL